MDWILNKWCPIVDFTPNKKKPEWDTILHLPAVKRSIPKYVALPMCVDFSSHMCKLFFPHMWASLSASWILGSLGCKKKKEAPIKKADKLIQNFRFQYEKDLD